MAVTPLTTYYGGKSLSYGRKIAARIEHIPHTYYVEAFGGMAGVLMAKRPSKVEVYNDLSHGLVKLFEVVRDPQMVQQLEQALSFTPYARAEWQACSESYRSGRWKEIANPVEQARQIYTLLDMSFNGTIRNGGWSFGGAKHDTCVADTFFAGLKNLAAVSQRLRHVMIECQPATTLIKRWDGPNTLFYLDPPYVLETRSQKTKGKYYYEHEMQDQAHRELIELLLNVQGKVILSGYEHEIYNPLVEAGWTCETYAATATSALYSEANGRKTRNTEKAKRIECLWLNPPAQMTRSLWDLEQAI